MALPPLTPEQRQAALEKAATARRERAELRNRLKYAQGSLAEAIAEGQRVESIGKMKVSALLESLPGVGKVQLLGQQDERIYVEFSYQRLAQLGLTANAIFAAIRQENAVAASGFVETSADRVTLRLREAAAGVEALALDHRAHPSREDFDRAVDDALAARGIELVCLAGFMRIVTPWLCGRWLGRMISIHPALLPAFKGLDTHARALEAGRTETGCTVHYVTAGLDEGPAILQARVPILPGDTPDAIAERLLPVEHGTYVAALRMVAERLTSP